MSDLNFIPLKSIYIRQGINIAGHQNRIYTADQTWDISLHPGGTLARLVHKPSGAVAFIATAHMESCEAFPLGADKTSERGVPAPQRASYPQAPDHTGLIANQVRHKIADVPVIAVSPPQDLGEDPLKDPDKAEQVKHEVAAKAEHFKAEDPAPQKKKRGRPRKVQSIATHTTEL